MSDRRDQLVALGVALPAAQDVAARLDSWLEHAGWVVGLGIEPEWLSGSTSSRFLRRPQESEQAEPGWEAVANICIDDAVSVWHPGEAYEGPACPTCGAGGDEASAAEVAWVNGGEEPMASCQQCGFTGLLGDWNNKGAVVRSPLAIVLWTRHFDSEPVVPALLMALRSGFGGRWTYVHQVS